MQPLILTLLDNMAELVKASDVSPRCTVVWLVPSNRELLSKIAGTAAPPPDIWLDVIQHLRALGYVVVDPRSAVNALYVGAGTYPFSVSGHFRPSAYAEVTRLIEPEVQLLLQSNCSR